jgi:hypothetical protein
MTRHGLLRVRTNRSSSVNCARHIHPQGFEPAPLRLFFAPLTNQGYGARLRSFITLLLHETDHRSDVQTPKGIVPDAVAMEVNIPVVGCP